MPRQTSNDAGTAPPVRPAGVATPGIGLPPEDYPTAGTVRDAAYCTRKADKIAAILQRALGPGLANAVCVDVGCAAGGITERLAPHVGSMLGIEYDAEHLACVSIRDAAATYAWADAQRLPVRSGSVDLVICAQVYEHVADDRALVREIERILKPGGVCFFSGPNRLDPIERHYGLPFVSWLPRPLADAYIRATGRGAGYGEHPRSYWSLRRLLSGFRITDYTVEMLRSPREYACQEEIGAGSWVSRLPRSVLRALMPLYPNYNWVLRKGA